MRNQLHSSSHSKEGHNNYCWQSTCEHLLHGWEEVAKQNTNNNWQNCAKQRPVNWRLTSCTKGKHSNWRTNNQRSNCNCTLLVLVTVVGHQTCVHGVVCTRASSKDNHRRKAKQVVVQEEQNSKAKSNAEHNLRNDDDCAAKCCLWCALERNSCANAQHEGTNQSSRTLNGHCCGKAAERWEYLWEKCVHENTK